MGATLNASAELINDKMMFRGESGGNTVMTDYIPPYGDGEGFMPLQLFLVSLSACMGGTVQVLAKAMKRHVGGMTVSAEGDRRETHPTMFENIRLHVRVVSADLTDDDMRGILKRAEETLCPVAAMIKATVPLHMDYEIVKE
jgi:putative redox protein